MRRLASQTASPVSASQSFEVSGGTAVAHAGATGVRGGGAGVRGSSAGVHGSAANARSSLSLEELKASLSYGHHRWLVVILILTALAVTLCVVHILSGNTIYSPATILDVLRGAQIEGATYAVWEVRLPRLLAGALAGFAYGVAGNTFQTMLRNPLASPDVLGITSGAGVVAVFCILIAGMGAAATSGWAILGSLITAGGIFALSTIGRFTIGKFILVGLGVQAFMRAIISFLLLKGAEYDVPMALRWLSGSLNGTTMDEVGGLAIVIPLAVVAVILGRQLRVLELGDTPAIMLGARPGLVRGGLVLCTVAMIACTTTVTGPIACVTLLAGPIATRLVGQSSLSTVPAGLVGMALVLASDLVGQYVLGTRFPVGVVTGLLGTPYLLWLLVRMNKKGTL